MHLILYVVALLVEFLAYRANRTVFVSALSIETISIETISIEATSLELNAL